MTRRDAQMIAEELYKLQLAQNPYSGDELLTIRELANRLRLSESYVRHHASQYPRLKVGGNYRYPFNQVIRYLSTAVTIL